MLFKHVPIDSKKKQKFQTVSTPDNKISSTTRTKKNGSIFFKRVAVASKNNKAVHTMSAPIENGQTPVMPQKTKQSIFFKRVSITKKETSKISKISKKQDNKKRNGFFSRKKKIRQEPVAVVDDKVHSTYSKDAEDFLLTAARDTRGLEGPVSAGIFSKRSFKAEIMKESYTPLTFGMILFTLSIASYFIAQLYFINPLLSKQTALIDNKVQFQNDIMKYQSQNPKLKKNISTFNSFVKTIRNKFYPANGVDEFFGVVTTAALEHNLKMEFTKGEERSFKRAGKEEIVFNVVPVQLVLEGGYLDYLRFREILVNSPKYVRFEKEQITNTDNKLKIIVDVSVALNNI